MRNGMRPIHPGEILKADVLDALGMSASGLAKALDVAPNRITGIVNKERALTADTALRLGRYLGGEPEFWLTLQALHDLRKAEIEAGRAIRRRVAPRAA
jgi:addiction module HigA family antidote